MLTTAPRLRVRRPSPTTAEFTVTTRPPSTLGLRLLLAAIWLARLLVLVSATLLLDAKWAAHVAATDPTSSTPSDFSPPPPLLLSTLITFLLSPFLPITTLDSPDGPAANLWRSWLAARASPPGRLADSLAASLPVWALAPLAAGAVYAALRRTHRSERLLVLRGLGVQTSGDGDSLLAAPVTRFIPTEKIRDVLVNEAFRGFEARYYLVVVVDGEDDVVVVFPRLLPCKRVVETVWRGVRGCLYEGSEGMRKLEGS